MTYLISSDETMGINIFPETRIEEILQNVRTLLSTIKGTVPLDRDLGIDFTILDRNILVAENLYMVEVVEVLEEYEPRVRVENIQLGHNKDDMGTIVARTEVSILG